MRMKSNKEKIKEYKIGEENKKKEIYKILINKDLGFKQGRSYRSVSPRPARARRVGTKNQKVGWGDKP